MAKKQEQLLIHRDEEVLKHLIKNLFERKKKLSGGSMTGGDFGAFFKDVLHGLSLPFTSDIGRTVLNIALPGVGEGLYQTAKAVDQSIQGSGGKRGRGRPRTKPIVPSEQKRRPGRPKKH